MNEFFRCVAEAKPTELKAGDRQVIALPGGLKMAFAYCPASATIEGFYTGVYPVTQAEYQAVIGSNPSHFQGNTLPVEQVSWEDAIAYCEKLKLSSGQAIRLPTVAEWEYACRGGTTTEFYFGNALNGTQANCNGNNPDGTTITGPYLDKTTPVGSYAGKFPHPWGLADVHGNVWEWCTDWYNSEQNLRMLRGGSWTNSALMCRAAYRFAGMPTLRVLNCGVRVCYSVSQ